MCSLSISQLYSHTVATLHYARGIAHAVLGDTAAAAQDLSLLRLAAPRVPADHVLHNNLCSDMLAIAEHMLQGELHYREVSSGNHKQNTRYTIMYAGWVKCDCRDIFCCSFDSHLISWAPLCTLIYFDLFVCYILIGRQV